MMEAMGEDALYRRLMAGQNAWTLPLRALLRAGSAGYAAAIALRNRRFDSGAGIVSVDVPVISVGNITAGGTGKTPLVIAIVHKLQRLGRKVAVLSRGYKAADEPADELQLVSRRAAGAVCIADPNRLAAARRAITESRVDAIVLDDAFQHRRLARNLDIVTIDATCPFGFGYLLPRGLLREPPAALRRAGLIVITRADQIDEAARRALHRRIGDLAPDVPRVDCRHSPTETVTLDGATATTEAGLLERTVCLSAIGNPAAFEQTARAMGANVVDHVRRPDHHPYTSADLERFAETARRHDATLLLTTEKDAVKLTTVPFDWPCPVRAVRIDIDFLDEGDRILSSAIDLALSGGTREHARS